MVDRKIAQCFGTKVRPRKPAKPCRKKYLWTAKGSSAGNFGSKGSSCCPSCGTFPDWNHPINRYLSGEIDQGQDQEILRRDYDEAWIKKV